jgi:hypothetical protein
MTKSLPIGSNLEQLLSQTKADGNCLIWQRGKTPNGYAKVSYQGKSIGAHRLVLFYTTGAWGQTAMHKCDRKECINPAHLSWGTPAENSDDMVIKGRSAKGTLIQQSKLNEIAVKEIRSRYKRGESMRSLGHSFGVSKTAIAFIVNYDHWRHVK